MTLSCESISLLAALAQVSRLCLSSSSVRFSSYPESSAGSLDSWKSGSLTGSSLPQKTNPKPPVETSTTVSETSRPASAATSRASETPGAIVEIRSRAVETSGTAVQTRSRAVEKGNIVVEIRSNAVKESSTTSAGVIVYAGTTVSAGAATSAGNNNL